MEMRSSADEMFRQAISAMQAGNADHAEALFRRVLLLQPKHVGALNLLGVVLTQLGRFAEAETYLRRALERHANSDATLYNYGLVLKALGRPAEALERFSQALKINSSVAETWNNRGTVFNDLKRHEEAIGDFDRAIQLNPRYAEAYFNKGKSLTSLQRLDEASAVFDTALALKPDLAVDKAQALEPDLAEAWLGRGNVFYRLKRRDDAFAAYDKALVLKPDLADAWCGRGNIHWELQRHNEALADFEKALALKPDLAEAWLGCGNVFNEFEKYREASDAFDRALALKPDLAEAWVGRGNASAELKRYDDAFAAYDRALALKPGLAEAWFGRGNVAFKLESHLDALAAYDKALAQRPDFAEAWLGRGNVFCEFQRYEDALAPFDRALALKPDFAEAWLGRGNVFFALKQYEDALVAFDRALALKPDLARAWLGRGNLFYKHRQYGDAFAAHNKALSLKPDVEYAAGFRLLAKLHLCDWTNLEADIAQVLSSVRARERSSVPFGLLPIPSSAADQLQCAESFVQALPVFPPLWRGESYSHDRIHVAYVSTEFREHAVGHLTVGLFEQHDRSRFEVTAISCEAGSDSDFCRRIKAPFERFIDVSSQNDQEIADLIRRLEIDIAVDLNGFTGDGRLRVFARRPAPIQVNYLGYAGTMGADCYDYIVADPTVIPREHIQFYREKVAWLPDSFLPNDAARRIAERTPTRGELGLPDEAFVFCSFNQSYKFSPEIFDIWMRLLREVEGSVLWLKENDAVSTRNLRLEAERRGVAPERLVFAAPVPLMAEHLARQRQADLFLDTAHYNAHTTASDALWAGLPVVTCPGSTFAARVAASLLQAVGLSELITTSLADYEALALSLARHPARLASIKAKLAHNRDVYPLFDTKRFARHIEAAYQTMVDIRRRGESPRNFSVEPM